MKTRSILMLAVFAAGIVWTAPAFAQSGAAPDHGYVMGAAQSAFGNVTTQNFGAELGVTVFRQVQVFAEVGLTRDTAPAELGTATSTIAGALTALQSAPVAFSVKQPVTFGAGGIRYVIPTGHAGIQGYVLAGAGMAQVKKEVSITIGGSTSTLAQYVSIGSDLTGDETKPLFTGGGGITWTGWQMLVVDLGFRVSRISAETPITVSRAGAGIGFRF